MIARFISAVAVSVLTLACTDAPVPVEVSETETPDVPSEIEPRDIVPEPTYEAPVEPAPQSVNITDGLADPQVGGYIQESLIVDLGTLAVTGVNTDLLLIDQLSIELKVSSDTDDALASPWLIESCWIVDQARPFNDSCRASTGDFPMIGSTGFVFPGRGCRVEAEEVKLLGLSCLVKPQMPEKSRILPKLVTAETFVLNGFGEYLTVNHAL